MATGEMFISVILPLKLEWEPCYKVDGTASDMDIVPGDRVNVTFAGKSYLGVVSATQVDPDVDREKIKGILSADRTLDRISRQEIELWRQVASYYICTVGEVYKAAYPMQKISSEEALARRAERLEKRRKAVTEAAVRKLTLAEARQKKALEALAVKMKAVDDRLLQKTRELSDSTKESTRGRCISQIEKLNIEKEKIRQKADMAAGDLQKVTERIKDMLSQAGRKDKVQEQTGDCHIETGITLTDAQNQALESISSAFAIHRTALLRGVTGSGKTEIYITLAAKALSEGKNVLYLVPEIALSKQLEDRIRKIFGERLLTFHSGETPARRAETAASIRTGSYIVLGTRSALFLPHRNLGIIIVDEEHDTSYKQDSPAPRYNGRDTAIMLGAIHSCPVLLGSATPSLESLYNCRTGKYTLVELTEKYHGAADADVEIIDTSAERKKNGMRGSLSLKLIFRIGQTLERGEQVLVLRSRRSYSPVLQCTSCGYIPKCPRCNVSLSYHKAEGKELCHYCGYTRKHTGVCPQCGGDLAGIGAGTQKIEEEIAAAFPKARTARLDSDSARDRKYENDIIRSFSRGDTDILIGTQMVAKGFDFSGLTLVAVIGADTLLGIQDFRADEKALQTLEQFRGRCGRRGHKGTLIIQTCQPAHPVYRQLVHPGTLTGDDLMEERHVFGYPPYCRIIDLQIKDSFGDRAGRMAETLCRILGNLGMRLTGPYPMSAGKSAGYNALTIRVSLEKDRMLQDRKALLHKTIQDFEKKCSYSGHISIDVDPV